MKTKKEILKMTDWMDLEGYCNKSYYTALSYTKNSIFIHIGPYAAKKMDVLPKVREIITIAKEVQYK
ncbi:MAG: hypothetical protein ABSG05_03560 [Candidatus Pacearchaeota archaeon]|jgi:hypothetical protein